LASRLKNVYLQEFLILNIRIWQSRQKCPECIIANHIIQKTKKNSFINEGDSNGSAKAKGATPKESCKAVDDDMGFESLLVDKHHYTQFENRNQRPDW